MFNTEKNIIKAFITSLVIFLLTIFIPKISLHASTITPIFDNKNLKKEVALKAIKADQNLGVFTIELNDKFDKIKHNYVHIAKEQNNHKYEWQKKELAPELALPLIITHNDKKVVIIGTDHSYQNTYITIQNFDDFFNYDTLNNQQINIKKYLPNLDYQKKFHLNKTKFNPLSLSKQTNQDIKYFWTGVDNSTLNIWTKLDNEFISLDVNTLEMNTHKLPLDIKNSGKELKITNQILSYNNGIYYAAFDIDNTVVSTNYGINHKIYYSYNASNWNESSIENQFGEYEILLDSYNLGSELYQFSINIDFSNFISTTNVWKISDIVTPWNKSNIKIPGESYIISLNKIGQLYNIIIMTPNSSYNQYDIRYFNTKEFDNFDYNSATPEIAETVNPQYKSLFYKNVTENNSDISYLEKHYAYKLDDKNQKAKNFKFELLKVQ